MMEYLNQWIDLMLISIFPLPFFMPVLMALYYALPKHNHYFKLCRACLFLLYFCFVFLILGMSMVGQNNLESSVHFRTSRPLQLFEDCQLTVLSDTVPENSQCTMIQMPVFSFNPLSVFKEYHLVFCDSEMIGWADQTQINMLTQKHWVWIKSGFVLLSDSLIILFFGLFFLLIKKEKICLWPKESE